MGQNEDYSLGGSISDSPEKLLQRGSIYIYDFGEGGGTCNHAHIFTEGLMKVAASHKEQMSSCHHEGF